MAGELLNAVQEVKRKRQEAVDEFVAKLASWTQDFSYRQDGVPDQDASLITISYKQCGPGSIEIILLRDGEPDAKSYAHRLHGKKFLLFDNPILLESDFCHEGEILDMLANWTEKKIEAGDRFERLRKTVQEAIDTVAHNCNDQPSEDEIVYDVMCPACSSSEQVSFRPDSSFKVSHCGKCGRPLLWRGQG